MSYFIASSITITPDKVIYEGWDNNIHPAYRKTEERKRTQEELVLLVTDLISGGINAQGITMQKIQSQLRRYYNLDELFSPEIQDQAVKLLLYLYNDSLYKIFLRKREKDPSLKPKFI